MKSLFVALVALSLCACADVHVVKTDVATAGGTSGPPIDTKDFGSVHMVTCGVGASHPKAIYVRPFCIDNAIFEGDVASSDGEIPIRKALTPVEFAEDLKEELEKLAPTRILRPGEVPRVGWLVEGHFDRIDGGDPLARFFFGVFGAGRSFVAIHVRITDVNKGLVVYEFDLAGGSGDQGKFGTVRASGLGRATHFDLRNAAERIYITLSTNPYRYAQRSDATLQ